jgi:hypothetical protein
MGRKAPLQPRYVQKVIDDQFLFASVLIVYLQRLLVLFASFFFGWHNLSVNKQRLKTPKDLQASVVVVSKHVGS